MRSVLKTAILASACVAAVPAVAQVSSPGPVYYNQPGIPAPGPVYYNAPPAMVSANPPHYNAPPPRVSPNPPYRSGPRQRTNVPRNSQRWGGMVNGRWYGGSQAPGGWAAYRRPSRGHQLDRYWMSSNFQIPDYYSFGLGAPPSGYFWVRYYDDAVLVDSYGRVRDSVSGIAWAGASASARAGYASASSAASASAGYGQRGGHIEPIDPNGAYYEDDQGYGDDIRYAEPQGGYAPPVAMGPPAVQMQHHSSCPNQCPPQVYTYGNQGYSGGGYSGAGYAANGYAAGGGYYAGGATTTTIVIQYPATVTTTTIEEEVIEESSTSYETTYVSRPHTKRIRRAAPARHSTKRLRRSGCGC